MKISRLRHHDGHFPAKTETKRHISFNLFLVFFSPSLMSVHSEIIRSIINNYLAGKTETEKVSMWKKMIWTKRIIYFYIFFSLLIFLYKLEIWNFQDKMPIVIHQCWLMGRQPILLLQIIHNNSNKTFSS